MANARELSNEEGPHVAMPLGGIGTGNVSICADGALRQWQLHNIGNHRGDLPYSFLALRVSQWEPPFDAVRVLQAPAPLRSTDTPLVNDDLVPRWQRRLLARHGGVQRTRFRATYPVAEIDYVDDTLPVQVSMEAFTPMVPLDVETSSLPVAMLTVSVTNVSDVPVNAWLGVAMQNPLGIDGTLQPDGVRAPGYGGNVNRVDRSVVEQAGGDGGGHARWTHLVMENPSLPQRHPGAGQVVVSADAPLTTALPHWSAPEQFLDFLRQRQPFGPHDWAHVPPDMADPQPTASWTSAGPSPEGSTWNGGLAAQVHVPPGETRRVRVSLAWWLPNRYANFTQFGGIRPEWGTEPQWLGNHCTTRFRDAREVADLVHRDWDDLRERTRAWTATLLDSGLRDDEVEHLAAQASIVRSPSFFRVATGEVYAFEGVQGASTTMWSGDVGGSCPLNCTHVLAYAQGLARLWPELDRSMRETELDVMQAPEGFIPHRVILPTSLGQLWDRPIGGPEEPALDGMLASVLKVYQQVRNGVGEEWLARYWPKVVRLMDHVARRWDPEETGMLHGIQPSTHDIDLAGLNTFMGTYWLAALRAAEELARTVGDDARAQAWQQRFRAGSAGYDQALFTGAYYRQVLEDGDPVAFQWGEGCLSDQLIGQWWAHLLDLGYLLPRDHVRTALRSVVEHNLRPDFHGFDHPYRTYADGDESGLVMCSWPTGGRPEIPTRYCDEVWTGIEYQVAAHCEIEGLHTESRRILDGVWGRYDGRRRNPYNEIECGDHYVRALSGWSVLEARTGQRWDARTRTLTLRRPTPGTSWPVVLHDGWGAVRAEEDGALRLACTAGHLAVDRLRLDLDDAREVQVRLAAGESAVL